jgi:hypothetical protein
MQMVQQPLDGFPGFSVEYDQDKNPLFKSILLEGLGKINSVAEGQVLLAKIANAKPAFRGEFPPGVNVKCIPQQMIYTQKFYKPVTEVNPDDRSETTVGMVARPILEVDLDRPGSRFTMGSGSGNQGMDEVARHDSTGCVCIMRFTNAQAVTSKGESAPAFIVLAHELIHSWHDLEGIALIGPAEEEWTTGIGKYAASNLTENSLRRAFKLPLRERYF